jgi:zinc protease
MLNERFAQIARAPGAPFLNAFSTRQDIGRDADSLARYAMAPAGHAEEALVALLTEVLRVERHGFSAGELERAKKDVMRGYEVGAKEADKTESTEFVAEATRYFLTDEMMPGRVAELAIAKELLPGITLAEVNLLARGNGPGDKGRAITISGPEKAPLPSKDRVAELVHGVARTEVTAWNDTPPPATLMAKTPTPGPVKATRTVDAVGVTEWTLANGVKVVVKPTDFKNDEVQLYAFSPGGTSLVADKDFESALFATQVVNAGGVGEWDQSTLDRALAGKVVRVNTFISELEEGVFGTTSPDDLEAALQLVYLRFTAPRKDEAAFTAWKTSMRDRAANRRLDPQGAFLEDMDSYISQKHRRRAPVTPEFVDKVNLDTALAIYKDRFADAGDFTFVIVGNVDLKLLQPLAETYLGSLPTKHRKEKWKDVGVKFPSGKKQLDVKQGSEPKSSVYYVRHAAQPWSKEVERDLKVLKMLLEIRLREVLREDMSGVYGVQVWTDESRRPRQERVFGVYFGCDPANVEKLRDAVVATVATIQKEGLGEEYLAKVRELITRTHETDLRENRFWTFALADAWRYGDDPKDLLDAKPLLDRVTLANVKAAAKKYLDSKDSVLAVLRPAEAAPAPAAPAAAPATPATK